MVNRKDLFSWKITAIPNEDIEVVFSLFRPKHQLLSSAFTMLLFERPDLGHSTNFLWSEKGKKRKKKAQHPAGFEPTTSRVFAPKACLSL